MPPPAHSMCTDMHLVGVIGRAAVGEEDCRSSRSHIAAFPSTLVVAGIPVVK